MMMACWACIELFIFYLSDRKLYIYIYLKKTRCGVWGQTMVTEQRMAKKRWLTRVKGRFVKKDWIYLIFECVCCLASSLRLPSLVSRHYFSRLFFFCFWSAKYNRPITQLIISVHSALVQNSTTDETRQQQIQQHQFFDINILLLLLRIATKFAAQSDDSCCRALRW